MSEARTHTTPAERRRAFQVLFVALISTGIGNSMVFAILPPMARQIGMSEVSVGLVYAASALLFTVMSQFWGRLSDRTGRRPIILLGYVGFAISMALFAQVTALALAGAVTGASVVLLLGLGRALYGALGSAAGPVSQAYVADRTSDVERTDAIATLTAAMGFGAAIGPGLAAFLAARLGLVAPLFITAALGLASALAIGVVLPERTAPRERISATPQRSILAISLDRRLRGFLLFGATIWTAQAISLMTVNFLVMDRLGVEGENATQLAGAVLTSGALAMMTAQLGVIPRLRLRPLTAMVVGGAATVAGAAMMVFAGSFGEIAFAFMTASLGMGMARPGMAAGASLAVDADEQGAAAGLVTGAAGFGFLVAPFTGLFAYQTIGPAAPYVLIAAVVAVATAGVAMSRSAARASARAR